MKRALFVAAIASAVLGCSTPPTEMSRSEYLLATSRTYPGATPEQVIEAATAVLTLADEVEFRFAHNPDGFQATKLAAGVPPTEYWELKSTATSQGAKASLQVNSTAIYFMPVAVSRGNLGIGSSGSGAVPVPGNAVYDLFWARVDYMLHKRDAWTTCEQEDALVSQGAIVGPLDPLCRKGMDDNRPGEPRAERQNGAPAPNVERMFRSGKPAPDRPPARP